MADSDLLPLWGSSLVIGSDNIRVPTTAEENTGQLFNTIFDSSVYNYLMQQLVSKVNYSIRNGGAWNPATPYELDSIVTYNSILYISLTSNTNSQPDINPTDWKDISTLEDATTAVKGIVELATNAEAITGTDPNKVVTTTSLKASLEATIEDATTAVKGIVELATDAEAITGTDPNKVVTTTSLKATIENRLSATSRIYASTGTNNIALTAIPQQENPLIYYSNMVVEFVVTANNTGNVNINVAGLGNRELLNSDGSELSFDTLVAGEWCKAFYDGVSFIYLGSGSGNGNGVPTGTIVPFVGTTPPDGFLLCNGAAVSNTVYADLYSALDGVEYGIAFLIDPTTFNIPDLRSKFIRGLGGNSGDLGDTQFDDVKPHTHTIAGVNDFVGHAYEDGYFDYRSVVERVHDARYMPMDKSGGVTETRPINMAMNYIIKY